MKKLRCCFYESNSDQKARNELFMMRSGYVEINAGHNQTWDSNIGKEISKLLTGEKPVWLLYEP